MSAVFVDIVKNSRATIGNIKDKILSIWDDMLI